MITRINQLNDLDIEKIESGSSIIVDVDGDELVLEPTDIEIVSEDIEGWLVASEKGITVALDITLNSV